jgi:thioredoxin:protein disulfide reductase
VRLDRETRAASSGVVQFLSMLLVLLLGLVVGAPANAGEFLDPQDAFKVAVQARDARHIEIRFDIAPGYHLYRERFSVTASPGEVRLGGLQAPTGKREFDSAVQQNVEVFRESVTLVQVLEHPPATPFMLQIGHQGCADEGLCYPPMEQAFEVASGGAAGLSIRPLSEEQAQTWQMLASLPPGLSPNGIPAASASASTGPHTSPSAATDASAGSMREPAASLAHAPAPGGDGGRFESALKSRNLASIAGVFLLAGVLLSFTPCVLPMVPILSSIIVGRAAQPASGQEPSRCRGLSLALAYSLGMALVYTVVGMVAGLMGEGLAAALQNAWVLGAFSLLLVALSLSMFDVYQLQLPGGLQSRLNEASARLKGGHHVGVFLMGGLSALMVGPCVAAPLAGALVYISRTHDAVLGSVALFSLAAGMSVPLLLVGFSAQSLLPRAGRWMDRVKHFFGAVLLAMALWMVSPVLPVWALMTLAALLLLSGAVYLGAFEALDDRSPGPTLRKGLGLALAALSLMQGVGAASGGHDILQPLRHLAGASTGGTASAASARQLAFENIASLPQLDAAVARSKKPVLVDLYADWCVACKELEALTFSDDAVRQRMAGYTLLRVDVTENKVEHKALMRRYGLFGPPALLFFDPAGAEQPARRVIGFLDAEALRVRLDSSGS